MTIGFHKQNKIETNSKRIEELITYINKPGVYTIGYLTASGVLKEINPRDGYIKLQPSIVYVGNFARLEEDFPTTLTMEPGVPMVFRPLQGGDLQHIVEENNLKAGAERNSFVNKYLKN